MSAMTNLLIKDDSAVEKTLVPVTDTPNPFWRAIATGVPLEAQIRATMYNETLKNGSQKTSLKLEVPTQETLGASGTSAGYVAPPKVAYTNVGFITMFSDKRATSTDRANLYKMLLALLAGASSTTATGTLNGASASGDVVGATAPVPYSFVQMTLPN